jgi:hypothetical protein
MQQVALARTRHMEDMLLDAVDGDHFRGHLDLRRVDQNFACQLFDLARHGGREQHGVALARQHRNDFTDIADEAHIEHAVALVEDERLR